MLILGRKPGESVCIGEGITLTVLSVDAGGSVSIGIDAPRDVLILRSELKQAVSTNQEAACSQSTPQLLQSLERAFLSVEVSHP